MKNIFEKFIVLLLVTLVLFGFVGCTANLNATVIPVS